MERLANYGSDDDDEESSIESNYSPETKREPDESAKVEPHEEKREVRQMKQSIEEHLLEDEKSNSPTYTPPRNEREVTKGGRRSVSRSRRTRSRSRTRRRSRSRERKQKKSRRSRSRSHSNREQKRKRRADSGRREHRRSRTPKDGRNSFTMGRDEREREHRRGGERYRDNEQRDRLAKRFDRASSKLAHLEKMGIDIKSQTKNYDAATLLSAYAHTHQSSDLVVRGTALNATHPQTTLLPPGVTDRLREQMERRKALWIKKSPDSTNGSSAIITNPQPIEQQQQQQHHLSANSGKVWEGTTFAHDQEGKQASKFKRLMGIRQPSSSATTPTVLVQQQEALFSSMEQQYEVARTATHTMRGVGLGFGSYQR